MPATAKKKKDPAAVALGRKGGRKGGLARAANLTPAERSEGARKAVRARWAKSKATRSADYRVNTEGPSAMKTFTEFVVEPQSDGLFEMANISPKRTGLPFVVWISPKAGAPHDVRVKVSKGPKVHSSELVSVAIRPDVQVVGGKMTARDLAVLKKWVELNRDVLIQYWDGDIEYTEDALAALKPLQIRTM
jgi:hypothetical protein